MNRHCNEPKRESQMSNAKSVLIYARNLLEKGWCQNYLAKDADGKSLEDETSPRAVSFCIYGALGRASFDLYGEITTEDIYTTMNTPNYNDAVYILRPFVKHGGAHFNDDHNTTKEMVLAVVDKCIEAAQ